jgi:hypothetical protein
MMPFHDGHFRQKGKRFKAKGIKTGLRVEGEKKRVAGSVSVRWKAPSVQGRCAVVKICSVLWTEMKDRRILGNGKREVAETKEDD